MNEEYKKFLRNKWIVRTAACITMGGLLGASLISGGCSKRVEEEEENTITQEKSLSEINGDISKNDTTILEAGKHVLSVRVSYYGRNDSLAGYAVNNIPAGYEVFDITPYAQGVNHYTPTVGYDIWFKNTEPVKVTATYNEVFDQYGWYTFGEVVEEEKTLIK